MENNNMLTNVCLGDEILIQEEKIKNNTKNKQFDRERIAQMSGSDTTL